MKRIAVIICYVSLLAMLAACDSTTGKIIDDYNRSKHPIARISALPDVVTADKEADITVGGKDITAYRYRLNNSTWSTEFQVDIVLELRDITPGKQKLEVIGTINGRDWQAQNQATACSWEVVPDWSCLKDIQLNKGSLCPAFNPYSKEKQEYTVLLNEQDARIDLTPLTYDVNAVVAYREYTEGTAAGTFTETVDPIVSTLAVDETRIFEIRVSSDRAADDMVYTVTVTRESRKWSEPVKFAEGQDSKIVIDNAGVMRIIYVTGDNSQNDLWAMTYSEEQGFGTPQKIGSNEDGIISSISVCSDKYGNILVVWLATDKIGDEYHSDVWANRYIKGLGWQKSLMIENDPSHISALTAKCDMNGDGIVSWIFTQYTYNLYARHFNIKEGWSDLINLGEANPNYTYVRNTELEYDYSGNAYLAWNKYKDGIDYFYVARYDQNTGWGKETLIKSLKTNSGTSIELAFDRFGNGLLTWAYFDGKKYHKNASRYTPAGGWGGNHELGDGGSGAVAFDSAGNALVVWYDPMANKNYLYLAKYSYVNGWQSTIIHKAENDQFVYCWNLVSDQNDNFIIVYSEYDLPGYTNCVLKTFGYNFTTGMKNDEILLADSSDGRIWGGAFAFGADNKVYYVFDHYNSGNFKSFITTYSND